MNGQQAQKRDVVFYILLGISLFSAGLSAESIVLSLPFSSNQAVIIESARTSFTGAFIDSPKNSYQSYDAFTNQLVIMPDELTELHHEFSIEPKQIKAITTQDFTIRTIDLNPVSIELYSTLTFLSQQTEDEQKSSATLAELQRTLNMTTSLDNQCQLASIIINLLIESHQTEYALAKLAKWKSKPLEDCHLMAATAVNTYFKLYRFEDSNSAIIPIMSSYFIQAIRATQPKSSWPDYQTQYATLDFYNNDKTPAIIDIAFPHSVPRMLLQLGFSNVLAGSMQSNRPLMDIGKYSLDRAHSEIQKHGQIELLPELYNGLATYWSLSGDNINAARFLEMAIAGKQDLNLAHETGDYLNNLGLIYLWSGRLAQAQRALRSAIQVATLNENYFTLATQMTNLAKTYRLVGDTGTARRYYEKALALSDERVKDKDTVNLQLALAQTDLLEEQYHSALQRLLSAQNLAKILRPEKLAIIYSMLALTYAHLDQHQQAQLMMTEAELNLTALLKDSDKYEAWLKIAAAQLLSEQPLQAQRSLTEASLLIPAKHHGQIELKILEYQLTQLTSTNNLSSLIEIFEQAKQVIFEIETTLDFNKMGPNWLTHVRKLYNLHIASLLQNAKDESLESILNLMDEYQSKSFTRKRLYYSSQSSSRTAVYEPLWQQKLEAEIAVVNSVTAADQASNNTKLDIINENWRLANTMSEPELMAKTQRYFLLSDIQNTLNDSTAVLSYIALEHQCYVVAITKITAKLETVQCPLVQLHDTSLSGVEFSRHYQGIKAHTYIPNWLLQQSAITQLVIVPDAKFQILPYHLLVLENNAFSYLGTRYEIVQAISLHTYFNAPSVDSRPLDAVVAVFDAPEFSPYNIAKPSAPPLTGWSNKLVELSWAKKEGNFIADIFRDKDVVRQSGKDASDEILMSPAFRQTQILHIATHSYYDPKQTEIVGLATAFKGSTDNYQPGFISQDYLLSQPFNNQLVVLSGCETALGQYLESEGFLSLANGVLSAGAGSTISTLWKVADQPTAIFMEQFYRSLYETRNSSVALLSARRALASNPRYRYPEYWAAFNLKLAHRQAENFSF